MKNIIILADAMRCDYISKEDMPFLHSLSQSSFHVSKIIPGLGFCERAEILTGKDGIETGLFTAIRRNNDSLNYQNPFLIMIMQFTYLIFGFVNRIFPIYFIFRLKKKVIKTLANIFFPDEVLPTYNIPPKMLAKLELSEDAIDHTKPNAFNHPSLVDFFIEKNIKYNFEAFTYLGSNSPLLTDKDRSDYLKHAIKTSNDDFYFLYLGALDAMGHKMGPDSNEFKKILYDFDVFIKDLYSEINKIDCNVLIIGDHGMSPVNEKINFIKEINRIARANGCFKKDYDIFCDSTVGRIWVKDQTKQKRLIDAIQNDNFLNSKGFFLNDKEFQQLSIINDPEAYGDMIWICERGGVIAPDFFHGSFPPKGMHGYRPDNIETFGTLILSGKNINNEQIEKMKLTGVKDLVIEKMIQ